MYRKKERDCTMTGTNNKWKLFRLAEGFLTYSSAVECTTCHNYEIQRSVYSITDPVLANFEKQRGLF